MAVLNIALHQDVAALRSDPDARNAFLFLLNVLISRQVTAALALQERALRSLAR